VINAIVLTTFFAVAFGNAVVSQFLGVALSQFAAFASMVLMLLGAVLAATAIFTGQASVLYTFYPPLKAHPAFYIGLALFIVGSWIAFYNWIPAYLKWRRDNHGKKAPLAVIGVFTTFIVWQIATIPVAVEVIGLLIPWSLGMTQGVNVVLARTLFWFFGHPLVYFWLLPTYTMYYAMLPKVAGGKLFSDFAGRFGFMMFVVFSAPLGLHHQFSDPGIGSNWKALHAVLTSIVAVPSMMTAFTLAASLEYASRARGGRGLFRWWGALPYFDIDRWLFPYFFCGLLIFVFGGATGVVNASYNVNAIVHNTSWIPAHFHMTVAGPVFLAILGMSLYMITGLLGKKVASPKAALLVPYIWALGIFTMSGGLFIGGLRGEPRRTNMGLTYLNPESTSYRPDWVLSSHMAAVGGTIMTLAIVLYFVVLVRSLLQPSQKEISDNFELPAAEPLHNENIGFVKNFRPWLIAAVIAVTLAYTPPIAQILKGNYREAPGYHPDSPVMLDK
jgi:cytochrome c oxidase subunit 1